MTNGWGNFSSKTTNSVSTGTAAAFQTVGAGGHYLADNTYRNSGATNLNASLLADLKTKTTFSPVEITTNLTGNTTLSARLICDTDIPDRGYHYTLLEYAWAGLILTNATLQLTNGVVVGTLPGSNVNSAMLYMKSNGKFFSDGSATQPNILTRYQTVQEGSPTNLVNNATLVNVDALAAGEVRCRFTDWYALSGSGDHLIAYNNPIKFTDCRFSASQVFLKGCAVGLTNCLFERVTVDLKDDGLAVDRFLYNNLWRGGKLWLVRDGTGVCQVRDNLFDQTTNTQSGTITHDHNAYVTNYPRLTPNGSGDVILTNAPVYQTNWLGRNFYPPNDGMLSLLLNAGSRSAANAGLWHFTTTTNQAVEGNSTVDIGFHFVAVNSSGVPIDTDLDGFADYFEDRNGNGVVESVETSYVDGDTDYDGRSDWQEWTEGTNPLDPNSMKPVRLGYWRFNTSDFKGENGQLPLVATSVQSVSSFEGSAVQVTNVSGRLRYNCVETNGQPDINFRNGSIRFLYKPLWSSTNVAGGTGPGADAYLFALGRYTNAAPYPGCFLVAIDATGTKLTLVSQTNGADFIAPNSYAVTFYSNLWYDITVTIATNTVGLWIDNVDKNFTGAPFIPPANTRAEGFVIGNHTSFSFPARGVIDELETFNYPLGNFFRNGRVFTASATNSPPRIDLRWRTPPAITPHVVQRKLPTDTNWTTVLTNYTGWSYTDTNVTVGQKYEYQMPSGLGTRTNLYIQTGINLPPVESRGRVILLVDNTVTNALATELDRLKTDLVGDGWTVLRHNVARHNDSVWSSNTNNIAAIKSIVTNAFYADTNNTKSIFIVGHVAIPYSGFDAEDSHSGASDNHFGAWPMDIYYGDVDGIYTDALPYSHPFPLLYLENTNSIGDGKFDQNIIPTNSAGIARLELSVGRIDFARMPAFSNATPAKTEIDLLRQYLNKNHRYRHKQTTFSLRTMAGAYFSPSSSADNFTIYDNALINGSRQFGFESGEILQGDLFVQKQTYLWGMEGALGGPAHIGAHTTADLTNPTNEPPIGFILLLGSFSGDWNLTDNLMRATLGTTNYGLACMWVRDFRWRLERMGLGDTLGDGLLTTANDPIECPNGGRRVLAIMGDPTLRIHASAPPANLTGATNGSGNVVLNWSPSTEPNAAYHVYRAANMDAAFTRLTTTPTVFTSFTETSPPGGQKVYQVRTVNVINSGSGSYTNLSQGIFITVN